MKIVDYSHTRQLRFTGEFEGQQPQVRMFWIALACVLVPAVAVALWKPVHPAFFALWAVLGAFMGQLIWAFGGDIRCSGMTIARDLIEWQEGETSRQIPGASVLSFSVECEHDSDSHRTEFDFDFELDSESPFKSRRYPWLLDVALTGIQMTSLLKSRPKDDSKSPPDFQLPDDDDEGSRGSLEIRVSVDWIEREQWLDLSRRCALILGMTHEEIQDDEDAFECKFHRKGARRIPPTDASLPSYATSLEELPSSAANPQEKLKFNETIGALQTVLGCCLVAAPLALLFAALPRWMDGPLAALTLAADLMLALSLSLFVGFVVATALRERMRAVRIDPASQLICLTGYRGRREIPLAEVQRVALVKDRLVIDTCHGSIDLPDDFDDMTPEELASCATSLARRLGCETGSFRPRHIQKSQGPESAA